MVVVLLAEVLLQVLPLASLLLTGRVGVEYGTSTKKTDPKGAAKKVGTDALKINLNTGSGTGSGTGGLNTP